MKRYHAIAGLVVFLVLATLPLSAIGQGQAPQNLPLSPTIRPTGQSVTPAFEGWFENKDGTFTLLVGYFNRNEKEELFIPVGPNNRIEPGGPDMGQPTHFFPRRQWGVFTIKVPKDFGTKKLTWTIVANGLTNTITLHLNPKWIVEPWYAAGSGNTPPVLRFNPEGPEFSGPPTTVAASYTASVGKALDLTVWASDKGPTLNLQDPDEARARRGRGAPPGRGTGPGPGTPGAGPGGGRPGGAGGDEGPGGSPPLSVSWNLHRGPAKVTFSNARPSVSGEGGKAITSVVFSKPGEYILRAQANDSSGEGGGGFQCCWTNTHIKVTVTP